MPNKLNRNNRFVTVRSLASLANDSTPPATSFDDTQRFDASGSEYIIFYWTGTTPGGTMNVTAWILDGIQDQFVQGAGVTGLTPNTLAKIQVHGATNAALLLSDTASASGTDIVVRAFCCPGT